MHFFAGTYVARMKSSTTKYVCLRMFNWLKNTFQRFSEQDEQVNYVIAEYHATKKKRVVKDDPMENEFETDRNATGEYMQIDRLHQSN